MNAATTNLILLFLIFLYGLELFTSGLRRIGPRFFINKPGTLIHVLCVVVGEITIIFSIWVFLTLHVPSLF